MEAIITSGLTKRYGSLTAVDGLDLAVQKGELFALLGVNGAGKSTTIRMLSTLTKPTSGEAWLMGHSICDEQSAVRQCISSAPQQTAVARNLTVRENLELMAGIYGQNPDRIPQILKDFSLEPLARQKAKTLSGGWQRRLSLAMALVSQPEVLFLDEPTLGLDVLARRELWAHIQQLKGQTTIILTTHYLEEAEALADRIGILVHGRLRAVGTAAELMEKSGTQRFEDAFVALCAEEAV